MRESQRPLAREIEIVVGGEPRTYFDIKFPIFDATRRGHRRLRDRHRHHRPQARRGRAARQRAAPPLGGRRARGGRAAARHERHRHRLQPERGRRWSACRPSDIDRQGRRTSCRCGSCARTATEFPPDERPGYRAFLTGEPQLGVIAGHPHAERRHDLAVDQLQPDHRPADRRRRSRSRRRSPTSPSSAAPSASRRSSSRSSRTSCARRSPRSPATSSWCSTRTSPSSTPEQRALPRRRRAQRQAPPAPRRRPAVRRPVRGRQAVARHRRRRRVDDVAAEAVESAGPRADELGIELRLNAERRAGAARATPGASARRSTT